MNQEMIKIIETKRKKELLMFKGFAYHIKKFLNNEKVWRCIDRKCNGKIYTTSTNIVLKETPHTHLPDYGKNEAKYMMQFIKKRSVETKENARDILDASLLQTSKSYKYL
ncbi:hypothetical protein DMUE_1646, partial [Dictyocoela muelleri]